MEIIGHYYLALAVIHKDSFTVKFVIYSNSVISLKNFTVIVFIIIKFISLK